MTLNLLVLAYAQADGQQAEELVTSSNTCLSDCLDKHAPWRYVRVKNISPHPWYDAEIDDAKEKKRKWENLWRKKKFEIHRHDKSLPAKTALK